MALDSIAVITLASISAGGIAWVFLYPLLSGERQAERRMSQVSAHDVAAARRARRDEPTINRRQQVEDSLKALEERQKNANNPSLAIRLNQAGVSWSKQQYYLISAGIGLTLGLIALLTGQHLLVALGAAFAGGFGIPRWLLSYLKKRREAKFVLEFPAAIDVIVRGVKAGLPLGDCITIIANEAQEPVRTEFRLIVEATTLGVTLPEAVTKLYERVPLPEANFFGIVVAIQQRTGGNLSEVLGNLSRVLRDRKKMKGKIAALSMEAKASAWIIGSLPVIVAFLIYLTSQKYIELLWTTPIGQVLLVCSAVWMTMGILVMKRMINFDF
ncbi:type II secretion system F family protein [Blastochloris viridis]|uniref:Flp pilus assembly protein TadB n=1 Tax=Blastochloris viridis TaxID=1079 RepID=A0A0H5BEK9_BLAVI|nr:type II secretion system F family protein [Blastochloris viridis]ALK10533.1 Bacterial type II secretion system protein F domain protein [Blastochloris viridis]BAR99514.1 Flp pilus assembly protein TadB [Blastochloris viridis]CUU43195.1 Flp pilus assembly protein TadB [Blastochloris viridis]